MVIESISNPKVQLLRSLYSKKGREESGLFVVEGINILKDLPDDVVVKYLFIDENRCDMVDTLVTIILERNNEAEVITLSTKLFSRVAETIVPQGLIACCEIPEQKRDVVLKKEKLMLLDGVSDPGNVGTIIRSAAAAGFDGVVLFDCCDPYSPKVVRSSMGGIFRIPCITLEHEEFKFDGTVYLLDASFISVNIFDEYPQGRYAIVVGSEAHGPSLYFRLHHDRSLKIPMKNTTESLNAGVSASLAMYILENNRR